jgi:hypothetical protein
VAVRVTVGSHDLAIGRFAQVFRLNPEFGGWHTGGRAENHSDAAANSHHFNF